MELFIEGGEVGERAVNMCARAWSLQTTCTIWCNWKETSRNTFEAGYMMSMMSTKRWILHFKGCPLNNTQFVRTCALIMLHLLVLVGLEPSGPSIPRWWDSNPRWVHRRRPTGQRPRNPRRPRAGPVRIYNCCMKKIYMNYVFVFLQLCFLTVGACKDKKTIRLLGQTMYTLYNTYGIYILINFISFSPLTVESNKPTWTLPLKQDTLPFEMKLDWQHTHTQKTPNFDTSMHWVPKLHKLCTLDANRKLFFLPC